jgi:hypothetical protein
MYLWRSLPEGQLLAVLRWMSARRERGTGVSRLLSEANPAPAETGEKAPSPTRPARGVS